jgi:hypothetical protein
MFVEIGVRPMVDLGSSRHPAGINRGTIVLIKAAQATISV